jgi:hypothetical protein
MVVMVDGQKFSEREISRYVLLPTCNGGLAIVVVFVDRQFPRRSLLARSHFIH